MKKKILALVFAGTLMCGSVFQVSAEGSATASDVLDSAVQEEGVDYKPVEGNENAIAVEVAVEGAEEAKAEIAFDTATLSAAVTQVSAAKEIPEEKEAAKEEAVNTVTAMEDVPSDAEVFKPEEVTVTAFKASEGGTEVLQRAAKAVSEIIKETVKKESNDSTKVKVAVKVQSVDITADKAGIVTLDASVISGIDVTKVDGGTQRVYVLHDNGTSVEQRPCKVINGVIAFYVESFSPVHFVIEDVETVPVPAGEEEPDDDDDDDQSSETTNSPAAPVSPKTADANVAVVMMLALVGMAGVVVCQKKRA